jgi:hypothetical protein
MEHVRLLIRGVCLTILVVYAFGVQVELLLHGGSVTYVQDSRFWADLLLPGVAAVYLVSEWIHRGK